ncbi:MAG: tryptophan--tRNA ligase, partial [Alphaproteobacteria bacterium]|nr:tryptophan--tRNA ligase [Alphaproteobacteria bacterium]
FENKDEIDALKSHYRKGGLGDMTLKSLLNETLQKLLEPFRERRSQLKKNDLVEICFEGTKQAKIVADQTLKEVKNAIGINFFGEKIQL